MTAVPTQARAEGLTEQMGDILLQCSGSNPGAVFSGNLTITLPVSITNRVDSRNLTTDAVLSVDYGSGYVPTGVAGLIANQAIAFNGVNLTVPSSGNFSLKISNIRGNVYLGGATSPQPVRAMIAFGTPASILVNQAIVVVAYPQLSLYTNENDHNITCTGSPVPETISMANLFTAGTIFTSTRLTEGFAAAFQPKHAGEDNGTRFVMRYSGFPANAHLYLPDAVAGSDAATPTAGGDLGFPQNAGQYVPGSSTLLLVRVTGTDANGAGGTLVALPAASGGTLMLGGATEVPMSGGAGFAVYEVVDSNPALRESAQFPVFVGLAKVTAAAVAQQTVTYAPVSTVTTASASAPVPRFAGLEPPSDCAIVGDCGAPYFPKLSVLSLGMELTGIAGGDETGRPGYITIHNTGGGVLNWSASVAYTNGSGWLTLDNTSGMDVGSIFVRADPKGLTAGTYNGSVTVDGGPYGGSVTVPVTLTVTAPAAPPATPAPAVVVSKVVNAATFDATPLVAGSLGTLMGTHLAGKTVTVTFDGSPATLLYTSDGQINFQVPAALAGRGAASMVVTVDGAASAPVTVALSPAWPSVFAGGILNQDNSVNAAGAGARRGSVLQIFVTGIPAAAGVSVEIGGRKGLVPLYAGDAPTLTGVQQVNVAVPDDVGAGTTQLVICAAASGSPYCSAAAPLTVSP